MAQIIDPIPADRPGQILCCYVNATSKIQIARISNIANWYFERVVFPGQRLVFEAFPEALLEIHTGMMASAILSDKIPCQRLRIQEDENERVENSSKNNEDSAHPVREQGMGKSVALTDPLATVALTSVG